MTRTLLHVLSQRPKLTGSGTTLDAFAFHAAKSGWNQHAVVGVPDGAEFDVEGIDSTEVHPLFFQKDKLNFPVPGMSDVMPYESTRFSSMSDDQLEAYKSAWKSHLETVISKVNPDVILSHHIWIVSSLLKDIAPSIPVVNECHATGLRQMKLCPDLADDVVRGCSRNDGFLVLRQDHASELCQSLGVSPDRVHVVGAGYNDALFHSSGRNESSSLKLIYVGKLSSSKGLPWLLDAVESLAEKGLPVELNVAGSGAGQEGAAIKERLLKMKTIVNYHGQLDQSALSRLMRSCNVCVLPSFYEGVPLVLVEAFACGCKLVSTALPGVVDELRPHLDGNIEIVPMPRLIGVDTPEPSDLPEFTKNLATAIERSASNAPVDSNESSCKQCVAHFSWSAVFNRVESVLMKTLNS